MRPAGRRPRITLGVLWIIAAGGALGAGWQLAARWDRVLGRWRAHATVRTIQTALNAVRVEKVRIPGGGRDGGLAPLGGGVLLSDRDGRLAYVDSLRAVSAIAARIPVNAEEFRRHPAMAGVDALDQFGVKDILIQETAQGLRLLATHNWFDAARQCYSLRLSVLDTEARALTTPGIAPTTRAWRTAFESWPCLPIGRQADGTALRPTIGAGGRIVALATDTVLVTLGAFRGETRIDPPLEYWSPGNAYGKTWRVAIGSGAVSLFTVGHRNPQGLARARDGTLWLTEHGARGGDELDRLREGANYGFPLVSYGTAYGRMTWPPNPAQGRHDGYAKPTFAWVPSVGVSQLVELGGAAFPAWRGDLVIGSLATQALYRLRLDGHRVVAVEEIEIGHRVRDLVEARDGSLVVKTDDDRLVFLRPAR